MNGYPSLQRILFGLRRVEFPESRDGVHDDSVSPNGTDDQGRGFDDEPQGDDLSVRMPVPEPRRKE